MPASNAEAVNHEAALSHADRALHLIGTASLFPADFGHQAAAGLADELGKRLRRVPGASAGHTIPILQELLQQRHDASPLLHLFVQAAVVKELSKDLWEESDSDTEEEEVRDNAGAQKPAHPLAGKGPDAMADYLMATLQEPAGVRPMLIKWARELGADALWEVLQETNRHLQEGSELTSTAQGDRRRTSGGVFFKLAKARFAQARKAAMEQDVPEFVLRPYQQKVVDKMWSEGGNWVVAAPTNTGKTAIFIEISKRVLAQQPGGTVVVLVPTVSLVRQQCIAYEKAGDFRPATGGGSTYDPQLPAVDWFCGDKPLPPRTWHAETRRLGVIVIEAQSFANLLDSGHATLADIQLLVLDECHHTVKDHPYARVMRSYLELEPERRPKVLGVSASPANGKNEASLRLGLDRLLSTLHAKLLVVSEHDALVQEVAPIPEERELQVAAREEDGMLMQWLRHLMHHLSLTVADELEQRVARMAPQDRLRVLGAMTLRPPSLAMVGLSAVEAYNGLCKWMNSAMQLARTWSLLRLALCVQVLEVLRRAEALCLDVGFECGLQYVAQRFVVLCARAATSTPQSQVVVMPRHKRARYGQASCPASPRSSGAQASHEDDEDDLPASAGLHALSSHNRSGPNALQLQRLQQAARPLADVAPCPDITLTAPQLCLTVMAALSTWDGRSTALTTPLPVAPSSIPQPSLSGPQALSAASFASYHGFGAAASGVGAGSPRGVGGSSQQGLQLPPASVVCRRVVEAALLPLMPGGLRPACHPKVWALVQYLQSHRHQEEFHGIVFCRSRQGAAFLVEVLRAACESPARGPSSPSGANGGPSSPRAQARPAAAPLGFLHDITLFVGHGGATDDKSKSLVGCGGVVLGSSLQGQGEGLAARGMNVRQQHRTLEEFKMPGRRVLVATSAAEEGIDLPCAEFVVRFSPPASAIQLVQGRGRARKTGSQYLCLVQPPPEGALQHKGNDAQLNHKSRKEEETMRSVLLRVAEQQAAL